MNTYDKQFKTIVKEILDNGYDCPDRTGIGVKKIFDVNIRLDLRNEYNDKHILPALTLRQVFPRTAFWEMIWMLSGSTDANFLKDKNIKIWDGNTSREYLDSVGLNHIKEGFIGDGYGKQFRSFNGVDQLKSVANSISQDPHSRRHLINLWNPSQLNNMALPPCHYAYQFCVTGDHLNLKFTQRSSDFILAGNQNVLFSTFFLAFMADYTGYKVGILSHSITDCHIYNNHIEVAKELLEKEPVNKTSYFSWDSSKFIHLNLDEALHALIWDDVDVEYQHRGRIDRNRLIMAV